MGELLVTLTHVAGSPSYSIKAESCEHTFTRMPTQAPLPASATGQAGNVFVLDLGMQLETITVTMVADAINSTEKVDLENACRTWWGYTNSVQGADAPMPTLTIDTGQTYRVAIKQATFHREGGTESFWTGSMLFLVANKVV